MNEKFADNIIDKKTDNKNIEDLIDKNKQEIKNINDIEDSFKKIKKNIDRTVELLHMSIKGGNIERKLDLISEDNGKNIVEITKKIDARRETLIKENKELYDKIYNKKNE